MPNFSRGASTLLLLTIPGCEGLLVIDSRRNHVRVQFFRPPRLPALLPQSCAPRSWTSGALAILVSLSFA